MSNQPLDLVGQTFERLTVIRMAFMAHNGSYWYCKCSCGGNAVVWGQSLKRGNTRSCGCIRNENAKKPRQRRKKE